jgi:hypothetical protein
VLTVDVRQKAAMLLFKVDFEDNAFITWEPKHLLGAGEIERLDGLRLGQTAGQC